MNRIVPHQSSNTHSCLVLPPPSRWGEQQQQQHILYWGWGLRSACWSAMENLSAAWSDVREKDEVGFFPAPCFVREGSKLHLRRRRLLSLSFLRRSITEQHFRKAKRRAEFHLIVCLPISMVSSDCHYRLSRDGLNLARSHHVAPIYRCRSPLLQQSIKFIILVARKLKCPSHSISDSSPSYKFDRKCNGKACPGIPSLYTSHRN